MNKMKEQYRRGSSLMVSVVRVIILSLAASAVLIPLLIIYTLPSLKLRLLLQAIPTFPDIFTPACLFVFLNLIILTILAMPHLYPEAPPPPSPLQSASDYHPYVNAADAVSLSPSPQMRLYDHAYAHLQLIDEVQTTDHHNGTDENDLQELIGLRSLHDANNGDDDDDRDDQADRAANTDIVIKKVIIQNRLQRQLGGKTDHRGKEEVAVHFAADRSTIDKELIAPVPESKRAEKADHAARSFGDEIAGIQGNAAHNPFPFDDDNIDSLLSEEGSIFTRAECRPLSSARFTHKKAGHDRPHSPLGISRPIVKRGDTLEATWKAICESKRHSSPLTRHYSKHTKRVDTHVEGVIDGFVKWPRGSSALSPIKQRSKIVMNSLHDHELTKKTHVMISTKPSMPREELNAKVESFISRFNEQIRIQREKSLLDYMEMVGRGTT